VPEFRLSSVTATDVKLLGAASLALWAVLAVLNLL